MIAVWCLLAVCLGPAHAAVALPVKINFQPTASPVPAGYLVDDGSTFASRGNGHSYGWNVSHTDTSRDRGVNADQRLDTLIHFHGGGTWEIELPNGTYSVLVSIGDASNASTHTLNAEGVRMWMAQPLAANQFANATRIVHVRDGRLTLDQGASADMATRVNYVEIASGDAALAIVTVAGTGTAGSSGDGGSAQLANLNQPSSVVRDAAGNLYVNDYYSHCIRRIAAGTGIISTIAGLAGAPGFAGDGGPASSARIHHPACLAIDAAGNLYFTDQINLRIRKITTATGIITTIAGTGGAGSGGDGGPALSATIDSPIGICVDGAGNVYFTDTTTHRVRKITVASGLISRVAGGGGAFGDGGAATSAQLYSPTGVTIDANGNLYIADHNNHRVRLVTAATGIITTVAGTGSSGSTGDGGLATAATLSQPYHTAFDAAGNLYISEWNGARIRKVAAGSGIITTFAGNGISGFLGNGGLATAANLAGPGAMWCESVGNLLFADRNNHRIRRIIAPPVIAVPPSATPSPATGASVVLSVLGSSPDGEASLVYTWSTIGTPPAPVGFSANGTNSAKSTTVTFQAPGTYDFQVVALDRQQLSSVGTVSVTVVLTATTIAVAPATAPVSQGATRSFAALTRDQFGAAMTTQPTMNWSVSGGGTISAAGVFTAGTTAGTWTVTATGGGLSGTATVTVLPPPAVSMIASDATASEPGDDLGLLTATLSAAATVNLTLNLTISGSATNGVDANRIASTVVVPAGQTTVPITVYPLDDALAESSEQVTLTVIAGTGYTIGAPSAGSVTILDEEPATVSVSASDNAASEPGAARGTGVFTVTATGSLAQARTVTYTVGGTATSGSDYTALSGTLSLAANVGSATITVTALNDSTAEPDETLIVTLTGGTNCTVGTPAAATVTVWDDEPQTVTVAATDASASEPGTDTGTFTLSRIGLKTAALTVGYTMGGSATSGSDFTAPSGTATIAANAATATVTLTALNDTVGEQPETAMLTLASGAGYTVGAPAAATVTIADNEPAISLTVTDGVAFETGGDQGLLTVTRTGATTAALTVLYDVAGSATVGDYQSLSGSVTIAVGSATATIPVVALDDGATEGVETVQVSIRADSAYAIVTGAGSGTVEIGDDDPTPSTVTISATDANGAEPGSDQGRFTITRAGGSTAASLTVKLAVTGTASAGADYQTLPTQVLIAAGATTALVDVVPLDDGTAEASETVIVAISASPLHRVGSPSSATVTLKDEELPVLTLGTSDATASEPAAGQGTGGFRITRTGNLAPALTVPYLITGSATSGSDFTALSGTATVAANASTATITLTALEDALTEADETVVMTIQSGSGYTLGSPVAATVTILDDETPSLAIAVSDASGSESAGDTIAFTITRTGRRSTALTVPLSGSGTASAGSDYTLPATLAVAANAATATLTITPADDTAVEGPESLTVTLGSGTGYGVGAASASATIVDNEPAVSIVAADAAATEVQKGIGRFVVSRSGLLTAAVTVNLTISGTATNGSDCQAISTTVTIPANADRVVVPVIPIPDANGAEGSETVLVTLQPGTGYGLATPASATVTIADDRPPVVSLLANPLSGAPPLAVTLNGSASSDPDGRPLTYSWSADGGIGVIATTPNASYGFTRPGPNLVTLTVSDGWMQASATTTVEVVPPAMTITVPTTIAAGDASYDWRDITVSGTTLTIDGTHSFRSLTLQSGGVVTHPAYDGAAHSLVLTVTNAVSIDASSRIDVSAKGYPSGMTHPGVVHQGAMVGTTGGSHGGIGSLPYDIYGRPVGAAGAAAYGDPVSPATPGAGMVGNGGGSGGGVFRLTALSLALNGAIRANGGQSAAGGSVSLDINQFSGTGTCTAEGGPGGGNRGSGGGGRVAIAYQTLSGAMPVLSAKGQYSGGTPISGAGTIFVRHKNVDGGMLTVDGRGVRSTSYFPTPVVAAANLDGVGVIIDDQHTLFDGSYLLASLTVRNGSSISHPPCAAGDIRGVAFDVAAAVTIDSTSRIDVSAKGYPVGITHPGVPHSAAPLANTGGSHGGIGSLPYDIYGRPLGALGADAYGDPILPITPGAGAVGTGGGGGGGKVRVAAGSLDLAGAILANGGHGGAGGSILLAVGSISGTGTCSALGGGGGSSPVGYVGSGGGGRISLTYATATGPLPTLSTKGQPSGGQPASGAGTIFVRQGAGTGTLTIDAKAVRSGVYFPTPVLGATVPAGTALAITDADASMDGVFALSSLAITANSIVTHPPSTAGELHRLEATATGSITLAAGSRIDVTGKGYPKGVTSGVQPPGAPAANVGGSHGGWGSRQVQWSYPGGGTFANAQGAVAAGQVLANPFGQFIDPTEPGGGSGVSSTDGSGGPGGGLVRLTAPAVTIAGEILALGASAPAGKYGPAGAGGSIKVSGDAVAISSRLCADGGVGAVTIDIYSRPQTGFGSGGGGRVALIGVTAGSDTSLVTANGGYVAGSLEGSAGTVLIKPAQSAIAVLRIAKVNGTGIAVFIDNAFSPTYLPTWIWYGPLTGAPTGLKVPYVLQLVLSGGATYQVVGMAAVFDADDDGLLDWDEVALGTGPSDADSNDDGILDGASVALGIDPLASIPDPDGDGVPTSVELGNGTDPYRADTDGDGVADAGDAFPTDPSRSTIPPPVPGDTTPPAITIDLPPGAIPLD